MPDISQAQPVAYALNSREEDAPFWVGFRPIDDGASIVRLLFQKNPRFIRVGFILRNGQKVFVRRLP